MSVLDHGIGKPDEGVVADPTSQTTATFNFHATEAGSTFECRLDAAAFAPCTSPQTYTALADGAHSFEVRATDPLGNTDPTPASHAWTVDATPPSIDSVVASETSLQIVLSEPVDSGTATDIANYSIDNGIGILAASLAADQITVTLTTSARLTGVSYTVTVTAVQDLAGNLMPATSVPYQFTSGLIGHWAFDEGSGTTANDSTSHGNTGTLVNGPAWVDGKFGKALHCDGADDYVSLGPTALAAYGYGEFTMAAWYRSDNTVVADDQTLWNHTEGQRRQQEGDRLRRYR